MKAFTNFRQHLPMPNCAVCVLERRADGPWSLTADAAAMRRIAAVRAPNAE